MFPAQSLPFSSLGRAIWQQAQAEAAALYHNFLGTEHILLALLTLDDGITKRLIAHLDLTPEILRARLQGHAGMGNPARFSGRLQVTPRLSQALENATEASAGVLLDERALLLALLEGGPGLAVRMLAPTDDALATSITFVRADTGASATRLRPLGDAADEVAANAPRSERQQASATPTLDAFGRDLAHLARQGKLKPIIGRRREMLEIARALAREERNVPVLVGEAGVGKTAIVEGMAERISHDPERPVVEVLRGKRIVELRMGELVADTSHRGEFEQRLQQIIQEASQHRDEVILFIDELHTIVGAGQASGSMDAAQMLKPALARGEIRVIGATTPAEYDRYIARDPALARRTEVIRINEATPDEAKELLRSLIERFETKYALVVTPEACDAAVDLAIRYIPDEFLPGKALDLLDTACAQENVGDAFSVDLSRSPDAGAITRASIESVVAARCGVPVGALTATDQERLRELERTLRSHVHGQDAPLHTIVQTLQVSLAGLRDPNRPRAVFFFAGPTGVGKTETARALASALFVGAESQTLLTINMGEFGEKHTVAKLIGTAPGYVGYEDEGRLTSWLRRHPFSVVLFDEIEKADPAIFDVLLELFQSGKITDGHGRTALGRDAIYILTSNLLAKQGSDPSRPLNKMGFTSQPTQPQEVERVLREQLQSAMRPEMINRFDRVILFRPLDEATLERIAKDHLHRLTLELERRQITLEVDIAALKWLVRHGSSPTDGARELARTIERELATLIARREMQGSLRPGAHLTITEHDDHLVDTPA